MNRMEYLTKIRTALNEVKIDQGIIDEVISDYEEHFRMGLKNNKTEEEICVELGSVEEIVAEISSMGAADQTAYESKKEDITATDTFAVSKPFKEEQKVSSSQAPFTKVQVDGICADVVIKSGDVFKIDYINEGNEKDRLAYQFYHYQEGDTFYAGVKENFRKMLFRVFHNSAMRLVVQVPTHVEEVRVKVASGDCRIEGVQLQTVDMYSASGDIDMTHTICTEANLHTSSGDITAQNSKADTIYIKSSSCDLQV